MPPFAPSLSRRRSSGSSNGSNTNGNSNNTMMRKAWIVCTALTLFVGVATVGSFVRSKGYLTGNGDTADNSSSSSSTVEQSRRQLGVSTESSDHVGPVIFVTIPEHASKSMSEEALKLSLENSNLNSVEEFIAKSKEIVKTHISEATLQILDSLHDSDYRYSALMIRGLPLDPNIPPTPTDGSTITLDKATFVAESMLVGFGELTGGSIVGYSSEVQYSNPWIHEGFPRESPGSALTSAKALSFHQDMSYVDHPPTMLGLVCVREGYDTKVQTTLLDNREILDLLPQKAVDILRQPRFLIHTSDWVDTAQINAQEKAGRPLLHGATNIHIPVDHANMESLDKEAEWALEQLKLAMKKAPVHNIHFEAGDLLLFSNVRAVHGRTPYTDLRFDGGDRVMNRGYFRKGLTTEERTTRMI